MEKISTIPIQIPNGTKIPAIKYNKYKVDRHKFNKIFSINILKYFYISNTSIKEKVGFYWVIFKVLNKWRRILCSWMVNYNTLQIWIPPNRSKTLLKFNAILRYQQGFLWTLIRWFYLFHVRKKLQVLNKTKKIDIGLQIVKLLFI